jgi:hypothetical protein
MHTSIVRFAVKYTSRRVDVRLMTAGECESVPVVIAVASESHLHRDRANQVDRRSRVTVRRRHTLNVVRLHHDVYVDRRTRSRDDIATVVWTLADCGVGVDDASRSEVAHVHIGAVEW